ncbi:MAG TPA: hypoxanthine-guanine phosphoribosyltransferase [Gammaproteobacteria bacterium]|nr:hypoxanthine-guanine phosphoribosyltransferase [Gammaproteobacteria bacterium]
MPDTVSQEHIRQVRAEADCLFTQAQVKAALDEMAEKISAKHHDNNPLVLCVMNGGLIVTGELLLRLDFPLQQDYLHATRYRGATRGGELHWLAEPRHNLKDRHVLVIDDILDEGYTLAAIAEHCRQGGAASVETVVLVEKRHDRKEGHRADYIGLEVEDRYLFGYGMDYKGYLRNAAGIFAVKGM